MCVRFQTNQPSWPYRLLMTDCQTTPGAAVPVAVPVPIASATALGARALLPRAVPIGQRPTAPPGFQAMPLSLSLVMNPSETRGTVQLPHAKKSLKNLGRAKACRQRLGSWEPSAHHESWKCFKENHMPLSRFGSLCCPRLELSCSQTAPLSLVSNHATFMGGNVPGQCSRGIPI